MTTHAKVQVRHRVAAADCCDQYEDGTMIEMVAQALADFETAAVERGCAAVCDLCRAGNPFIERNAEGTYWHEGGFCRADPIRQAMADEGGGCDE